MTKLGIILGMAAVVMNTQAISYNVNFDGVNAPSGAQFTAVGGTLEVKEINGWKGLGISGGAAGGEIDFGQKLTISFGSPQILDDIMLAFLYDGPEFSDGQEIAGIKINGTEYTLTATGETSANWTGSGTVNNVSKARAVGGGVWEILSPVGLTAVTSIELYPLAYPSGVTAPNLSDFSLRKFHTTPVPDGGATGGLLGIGAMALYAWKRKTQK